MKILICDDEQKSINITRLYIEEYLRIGSLSADIEAYTSAPDSLEGDGIFDIAFLDIEMPKLNGIALASELKKRNGRIIIFFITNHAEFLDDAMDLKVFRFFTKPIEPDRLYQSLDRAMEHLDKACCDVFFMNSDGDYIRTEVESIKYLCRNNRKTILALSDDGEFEIKESFEEAAKKLPNPFFCFVHKSFLINIHYITEYNYSEVFLGSERIPIATRKRAEFHTVWNDYCRKKSTF